LLNISEDNFELTVDETSGSGFCISSVASGRSAAATQKMSVGDKLLAVNGTDVSTWTNFSQVQSILQSGTGGAIKIKLATVVKMRDFVAKIRTVFDKFDSNQSGSINANELKAAMKDSGVYLNDAQCAMMVAEADEDPNGLMEFDEFYKMMAKHELMEKRPLAKSFSGGMKRRMSKRISDVSDGLLGWAASASKAVTSDMQADRGINAEAWTTANAEGGQARARATSGAGEERQARAAALVEEGIIAQTKEKEERNDKAEVERRRLASEEKGARAQTDIIRLRTNSIIAEATHRAQSAAINAAFTAPDLSSDEEEDDEVVGIQQIDATVKGIFGHDASSASKRPVFRRPGTPPLLESTPKLGTGDSATLSSAAEETRSTQIRKIFDNFDVNNSGEIDAIELGEVLLAAGVTLADDEIESVIIDADAKTDGKLTFVEFSQLILTKLGPAGSLMIPPSVVLPTADETRRDLRSV
jgi:Ca2+-binding EF-hand superfamily protein